MRIVISRQTLGRHRKTWSSIRDIVGNDIYDRVSVRIIAESAIRHLEFTLANTVEDWVYWL